MGTQRTSAPPVTWLLPVRNGMPYLGETLATIEQQTYRNWQVLAWDNGSTDGTVEELHRWIPHRLPGQVVSDRPTALGEARARLVQEAPTELCAWIDADDLNTADRLALQVEFLAAHPKVAAVGGQILLVDDCNRVIGTDQTFPTRDCDIVPDMLCGPSMAQPAVLFRRSAVLGVGNYRNIGPVNVEDYDLWLRLSTRYQLANLPVPVLRYRVHERSSTVVAQRTGVLLQATMERFAEHAPSVFGCTPEEACLLSLRRHPFALPVFLRMAKHLSLRADTSTLYILRATKFAKEATMLIAPGDWGSRFALWLIRKHPMLFIRRFVKPGSGVDLGVFESNPHPVGPEEEILT